MTDTPEPETVTVPASRLAWGRWNEQTQKDEGAGDIEMSYSADTIATSGKIRRTFKWAGEQMCAVSLSRIGGVEGAEAYRVILKALFPGPTTTYAKKVQIDGGETARSDPRGFYNSMLVSFKGCAVVLAGPPIRFAAEAQPERPEAAEQMSLFGEVAP